MFSNNNQANMSIAKSAGRLGSIVMNKVVRSATMKVQRFMTFLLLISSSSLAAIQGTLVNGIYTSPSGEFSVTVPYPRPKIFDSYQIPGGTMEFVDMFVQPDYPEMGEISVAWLRPEDLQVLLKRANLFSKSTLIFYLRKKENFSKGTSETYFTPVNNQTECGPKNINGRQAYQCKELARVDHVKKGMFRTIYGDPNTYPFAITAIKFGNRVALVFGFGYPASNEPLEQLSQAKFDTYDKAVVSLRDNR